MSQQREMIVTTHDNVPQGEGWKLEHVRGDYQDAELVFIWVREPVPDAWDYEWMPGMGQPESEPIFGYEPVGPWVPFAASGATEGNGDQYQDGSGSTSMSAEHRVHWRRPLRKIQSEGGAL